ncbi:MAG: hypothetical protein U9N31_06400 [Candidatus Marinimicrobia bacterium]|nr:hypothetical protein [Candidatus Neomarinimicrobiota bacterium]
MGFLIAALMVSFGQKPFEPQPETISKLGEELYSGSNNDSLLIEVNQKLALEPNNLDLLLEKAAKLEGLRRFQEAIELYSHCLTIRPNSPEILKRRGQRFISVRDWNSAIQDLLQATEYHSFIKPEKLKYTENLNWAIWYYLGVAYYLKAEFETALDAFQKSYAFSADNVSLLASVNWVHNCFRRLGQDEEAQEVVVPIQDGMGYTGNYFKCILVYNGTKTQAQTINFETAEGFELCTVGYGMGNLELVNGNREAAIKIFEKIIQDNAWQANGFMAAEAELSRLK